MHVTASDTWLLLLTWRRRQSEHDGPQFFELALRVGIHDGDGLFQCVQLSRKLCIGLQQRPQANKCLTM